MKSTTRGLGVCMGGEVVVVADQKMNMVGAASGIKMNIQSHDVMPLTEIR